LNTPQLIQAARAAESFGQIGRAEQLCRQVLFVDPKCVDALLLAGSIAARSNRVGEATALLRKALVEAPDSYDAVRWLAGLRMGLDGGEEAIELAQAAVRLRPKEPDPHVLLGMAYVAVQESRRAIPCFQEAVRLSPKMAGAYHNLGVAFQRDECKDEAIEAFQKALELAPGSVVTLLHLGTVYLTIEATDKAIECAQRAFELQPGSRGARRLLDDAQMTAVRSHNSDRHIREAIEQHPEASFPHALMGGRLQEQGKFDEAEEAILRSIELQRVQGFAYFQFAQNRKIKESDRPTLEQIEAVLQDPGLHPNDACYIHFALGKAYDDLKEYERAIGHLDKANTEGEVGTPEIEGGTPTYTSRVRAYRRLFTREFLERYQDIGFESDKPIFIFGMPRSGTTLLEQIISRHSTVGAAGEQLFWRDQRRRVVDLREGVLQVERLKSTGQKYLDLLSDLAPGSPHVTDKFPSNYVQLGLLQLLYPKAHFIHARRHPIDTALSVYMRPFLGVREFGNTKRKIVDSYKLYVETMEHWREVLPPGRFLEVDYELMVTRPDEMIRRVIAFCDLEWEDACLRPEEGDRRVITYSKWQVRQPVYTTSVARWRNYEPWLGTFGELFGMGTSREDVRAPVG
jgi:tetratricopeptide (TPR) repeat protein